MTQVSTPTFDAVAVGDELPTQTFTLSRADLVRYAGASGDLNPIHWNERFATEVGLPGVIAHGMLTMATAVRVVVDWVGDPGAVVQYGVRFTKPVPVHDVDGAQVTISGKVAVLDDEARTARVDLTATTPGPDGAPLAVLGRARAVVRLA
ncbi:MaoC/PaaZ C-terminal domain-containing protein [Angustibacter sp. McL0619]|uniref:MaoC/PaaZ C-terminal domain-containing protein n=1 Tax=Angustibacter sp. McL0619 TaxID=3415676 RepID=UPI003CEA29B9